MTGPVVVPDHPFRRHLEKGAGARHSGAMEEDRTLTCVDCGLKFIFSAAEQREHVRRGYEHEPRRCPPCRAEARRSRRPPGPGHITLCASCGIEVALPAPPPQGRAVLCDACRAPR
ncbi:MAG TPA: zinc-ribbon domain containing protein [Planctomycetota bacterium]|nr:zinc-ribbon domain containing protein [Planctomycetota bacterium]